MTRRLAFILVCILAAPALADAPPISAEGPWVREAPPGTAVAAAYMTMRNESGEAIRLTGVTAHEFEQAELHETVHENGDVRMRALDQLTVAAESTATLEPGGRHVMLREPRRELKAGDWVTLTMEFDNGQLLEVTAPVKRRTGSEERDNQARKHADHQDANHRD